MCFCCNNQSWAYLEPQTGTNSCYFYYPFQGTLLRLPGHQQEVRRNLRRSLRQNRRNSTERHHTNMDSLISGSLSSVGNTNGGPVRFSNPQMMKMGFGVGQTKLAPSCLLTRNPPYCGCTNSRTTNENPGRIRFPCNRQTFWFQPCFQSAKWMSNHPR